MGKYELEFKPMGSRWPWTRLRTNVFFESAQAAKNWIMEPQNQLGFAGDSCSPPSIIPTKIRIVESVVVDEFVI